MSPDRTSTSSTAPWSRSRAQRTASPVPRGCSWIATARPSKAAARRGRRRRRRAGRRRARAPTRAPSPPYGDRGSGAGASARRAHARAEACRHDDGAEVSSHRSTTRRLGRQDSNLGSRDQNPLPYRLATPHCAALILPLAADRRPRPAASQVSAPRASAAAAAPAAASSAARRGRRRRGRHPRRQSETPARRRARA